MASTNRLSPIPHPPTKPVVGNMLSLDSTAPVQNLARLAKELGPIVWLDMRGAPIVIVSGHDLVEELRAGHVLPDRSHQALELLRKVHGDVAREEDDPFTRGLRDRAIMHIDEATHATEHAIGDVLGKRHLVRHHEHRHAVIGEVAHHP